MSDSRVFLGGMDREKERLKQIQHMVITGCGTSLHAATYGAKL
jgi:glucosamine--fructose-6-phosphate aminotransferase (isomerizing)